MSFRLRSKFTGLFHDEVVTDSFWIRAQAALSLPSLSGVGAAWWMQQQHGDANLVHKIGAAARSSTEANLSAAAIGARCHRRLVKLRAP